MSGPMRSYLVLNGVIVILLGVFWWADRTIPYERIRNMSDYSSALEKLRTEYASATTALEMQDVASRSLRLAGRLNGRIGSLSDLVFSLRNMLGHQWWITLWVLVSNAILVSGFQDGRSSTLEKDPEVEREFALQLYPPVLLAFFSFLIFGLVSGEEISLANWKFPTFGLVWCLIAVIVLLRVTKIGVSPVGFRSWKLGGSCHWVRWQDIESVKLLWLPFGYSQLRVFYKGSPSPVLLPLCLSEFREFQMYALQYLEDQNPLREFLTRTKY